MSHEIKENDKMFSVRQVPWHGLGNIIEDYPTIEEAKKYSGLDWEASLEQMTINYFDKIITIPNNQAIVRNDTKEVLGVVGNRYKIYQNSEMWDFIEEFQKQTNIKLETAGSLKNGKTTWVLGKNGTQEIVNNDPIEEYFLFKNSFDGSTPISCLFTNIRVVCNNTLTAAIKGATNIFNVRHTKSTDTQIKEVHKALLYRTSYQTKMNEALNILAKKNMTENEIHKFVNDVIFPETNKTIQTVGENDFVKPLKEVSKHFKTSRNNKIKNVMNLIETGSGVNIKGVKGTAYGVYNALTEWVDHEKRIRITENTNENESRFINAFYGTGSKFKNKCFDELMKMAA